MNTLQPRKDTEPHRWRYRTTGALLQVVVAWILSPQQMSFCQSIDRRVFQLTPAITPVLPHTSKKIRGSLRLCRQSSEIARSWNHSMWRLLDHNIAIGVLHRFYV